MKGSPEVGAKVSPVTLLPKLVELPAFPVSSAPSRLAREFEELWLANEAVAVA